MPHGFPGSNPEGPGGKYLPSVDCRCVAEVITRMGALLRFAVILVRLVGVHSVSLVCFVTPNYTARCGS